MICVICNSELDQLRGAGHGRCHWICSERGLSHHARPRYMLTLCLLSVFISRDLVSARVEKAELGKRPARYVRHYCDRLGC